MSLRNCVDVFMLSILFMACQREVDKGELMLQKDEKLKSDYANLDFNFMSCSEELNSFRSWFENDQYELSEQQVQRIEESLRLQPEHIPLEPVLGGTMFYSAVKVLSSEYVIAEFEDGHIIGRGIYRFDMRNDTILFQLLDHRQLFAN